MDRAPTSTDYGELRGGYVVRAPRATDAVGSSLRNIYAADTCLSPELASLLSRLDTDAH
jgi:hypothetical protein